jgi:hypothetical protein
MATSQVVSLSVGSEFGFKRPAFAPVPIMETIKTFNTSTTVPGSLANTSSRVIVLSSLVPFEFSIGNTSTQQALADSAFDANTFNTKLKSWTAPYKQTLTIYNVGNATVTMFPRSPYRPVFSLPLPFLGQPGTYPVIHSINGQDVTTSTFDIPAAGISSLEIAYYGTDVGEFTSSFNIESTAGINTITVYTSQIVLPATFEIEASSYTTTFVTKVLGLTSSTSIELIPVRNGIKDYDTVLDFTVSLTESPGWSFTTGTNSVNLFWDPDYVNNISTTTPYTSVLSISVPGTEITTVTNSALVDITGVYKNLSTWLSPIAGNNSMIGVSLDMFDGVETLTIGVGAGGDGTPIYANGGSVFAVLNNLNFRAASIDTPYPYWATVCNIPLTGPGTYLSGALRDDGLPLYIRKTTPGLNYADYFGFDQSEGSIFIVDYDGYDAITIRINNLRDLSGNPDFDGTLQNLTRAFHYYSEKDSPGRYNNLPQYPFPSQGVAVLSTATTPLPLGETRTYLFRGFTANHSTATSTWSVDVGLVPFPT